jgi:hypothetical protein
MVRVVLSVASLQETLSAGTAAGGVFVGRSADGVRWNELRLTERPGDRGNRIDRSQRVAGAVKMLICEIENEHGKNCGHDESHEHIVTEHDLTSC